MHTKKSTFESDRFSVYLASRVEGYSSRYVKVVEDLINDQHTSSELLRIIVLHEFINPCFLELQGKALDALIARNDVKYELFLLCMHSTAEVALKALKTLGMKYELTEKNLLDLSIFASSTLMRREASYLLQFEKSVARQQIRKVA